MTPRFRVQMVLWCLASGCAGPPAAAPRPTSFPIIDAHFHAPPLNFEGNPPNPVTGLVPRWTSQEQFFAAALDTLVRYQILRAVTSGPLDIVARWWAVDTGRIVPGVWTLETYDLPTVPHLRQTILDGTVRVLGELGLQYRGMAPDDPQLDPYYALAEEFDIPVALHTGRGPARVPEAFRPLGNPLLLVPVLQRHPKLRVYLMHAGGPFVAETIELMTRYPSVYADLGRLNWTSPRDVFHGRLRALMQAGLGRRLMFGSDVNLALDGVRLAIQGIQSATFLSASEKRDIFFCNAVRFFKFSELGCL